MVLNCPQMIPLSNRKGSITLPKLEKFLETKLDEIFEKNAKFCRFFRTFRQFISKSATKTLHNDLDSMKITSADIIKAFSSI